MSCSDNKVDDTVAGKPEFTLPLSGYDNETAIETFFASELPTADKGFSKNFFIDSDGFKINSDMNYVIHSNKELSDIYVGDKSLPSFDFDKYILIIGQKMMPTTGYELVKQELYSDDNGITLCLYVKNDSEYRGTMLSPLYYWGLYPKQEYPDIRIMVVN